MGKHFSNSNDQTVGGGGRHLSATNEMNQLTDVIQDVISGTTDTDLGDVYASGDLTVDGTTVLNNASIAGSLSVGNMTSVTAIYALDDYTDQIDFHAHSLRVFPVESYTDDNTNKQLRSAATVILYSKRADGSFDTGLSIQNSYNSDDMDYARFLKYNTAGTNTNSMYLYNDRTTFQKVLEPLLGVNTTYLTTSGNINVGGTVDGRNIAVDGGNLDVSIVNIATVDANATSNSNSILTVANDILTVDANASLNTNNIATNLNDILTVDANATSNSNSILTVANDILTVDANASLNNTNIAINAANILTIDTNTSDIYNSDITLAGSKIFSETLTCSKTTGDGMGLIVSGDQKTSGTVVCEGGIAITAGTAACAVELSCNKPSGTSLTVANDCDILGNTTIAGDCNIIGDIVCNGTLKVDSIDEGELTTLTLSADTIEFKRNTANNNEAIIKVFNPDSDSQTVGTRALEIRAGNSNSNGDFYQFAIIDADASVSNTMTFWPDVLELSGPIRVRGDVDSTSSTSNSGIRGYGGLSVAKKAFIGDTLTCEGSNAGLQVDNNCNIDGTLTCSKTTADSMGLIVSGDQKTSGTVVCEGGIAITAGTAACAVALSCNLPTGTSLTVANDCDILGNATISGSLSVGNMTSVTDIYALNSYTDQIDFHAHSLRVFPVESYTDADNNTKLRSAATVILHSRRADNTITTGLSIQCSYNSDDMEYARFLKYNTAEVNTNSFYLYDDKTTIEQKLEVDGNVNGTSLTSTGNCDITGDITISGNIINNPPIIAFGLDNKSEDILLTFNAYRSLNWGTSEIDELIRVGFTRNEGVITYTGTDTIYVKIEFSMGGSNEKDGAWAYRLYKNTYILPTSLVLLNTLANEKKNFTTSCITTLATNDTIDVKLIGFTSQTFTVESARFYISALPHPV
jgi:hypothetical protein